MSFRAMRVAPGLRFMGTNTFAGAMGSSQQRLIATDQRGARMYFHDCYATDESTSLTTTFTTNLGPKASDGRFVIIPYGIAAGARNCSAITVGGVSLTMNAEGQNSYSIGFFSGYVPNLAGPQTVVATHPGSGFVKRRFPVFSLYSPAKDHGYLSAAAFSEGNSINGSVTAGQWVIGNMYTVSGGYNTSGSEYPGDWTPGPHFGHQYASGAFCLRSAGTNGTTHSFGGFVTVHLARTTNATWTWGEGAGNSKMFAVYG